MKTIQTVGQENRQVRMMLRSDPGDVRLVN